MLIFRVAEYIESQPTGRCWNVSAADVFDAVDSAWRMQYTSQGPLGDLIPQAVISADMTAAASNDGPRDEQPRQRHGS